MRPPRNLERSISLIQRSVKSKIKELKKTAHKDGNVVLPFLWRRWYLIFRIILVSCIFIGCVEFYIVNEGWSKLDAVFFIIFTATTVGYGHPKPSNDKVRLFTIFVMFFGILGVLRLLTDVVLHQVRDLYNYFQPPKERSVYDFSADRFNALRIKVIVFLFLIILTILCGAIFFHFVENWTWITSFYFAVQTSTTVGYGDVHINHKASKFFLIFYIIFSVILFAYAINSMFEVLQENEKLKASKKKLIKMQDLNAILTGKASNQVDNLSEADFILKILTHLNTIDEGEVRYWRDKFRSFDLQRYGSLNKTQFREFVEYQRHESRVMLKRLKTEAKLIHLPIKEDEEEEERVDEDENDDYFGVEWVVEEGDERDLGDSSDDADSDVEDGRPS